MPTTSRLALGYVRTLCARALNWPGLWVLPALVALLAPLQPALAQSPMPLSQCNPASQQPITIGAPGCGPQVYVDKAYAGASGLGLITINAGASLSVLNTTGIQVDTTGILVNGTLQIGSSSQPFGNTVTLNFIDTAPGAATVTKGISVGSGGALLLYGKTGVARPGSTGPRTAPSWTYLSAPAGPPALYGPGQGVASPVGPNGATTLRVAGTVDWTPGSWIVVAGTDYSPDSGEFVQVQSVSCASGTGGNGSGCTVTLMPTTPLVHYHYGGTAPDTGTKSFTNGVAQNYGVDERAEVGLVSRNIKLTAAVSAANPANGGEIMIMGGFSQVAIQGVEIEKFGKGRLGSYPVHFHLAGTVPAGMALLDSNSIHHSYNKCVTLHSTNGVMVSNNVCARAVGHLFYLEAGDETGNTFAGNLGIGAMSNAMSNPASITSTAYPLGNTAAAAAFWTGDYLVNGVAGAPGNGYNGFNVPFNDEGAVNGVATIASGFWITNLAGNTFTGNSVAGCQMRGRGYWLLPASTAAATGTGTFADNRAHGCYVGFDTASDDGVTGALLYTPQGACLAGNSQGSATNCDVVAQFDSLTASRNRDRGIWVRASWYGITNARLATNRDSVSLVSSGGTEGSPPGEWSLLRDAVVVGISANNPLRFGPCPYPGQNGFGANAGCYETVLGNGYPTPQWNFAGMMFYDGPARLENVRFVNFNKDITPYLTTADLTYLQSFSASNTIPCQITPFVYEGDAAMGWFQSNENSYPPTQYVQGLSFYNVDLRHQVYTQNVQLTCAPAPAPGGNFRDGDKFTVILDRDSTLTGFQVVPAGTQTTGLSPIPGAYPISLNNIPFLAGPGTADECLATGAQDQILEGRPTSLISPYSYATLEFSALTPPCNGTSAGSLNCTNNNIMIFTKDQVDYGGTLQFTDTVISSTSTAYTFNCGSPAVPGGAGALGHACVALSGRNGNGVYEPKLVNGLGYTVGATAGMPNFVSLMYGDASVPGGISATNPFSARVGICYKNQGQAAPPLSAFTVRKGSKSFSGPNGNAASLAPFYNQLQCAGLDNVMCGPLTTSTAVVTVTTSTGTGTASVTSSNAACYTSWCPSAPFYGTSAPTAPTPTLSPVASIADLTDTTKCPRGECFFYDQPSGLLFINMVQEKPNAGGPYSSPLGSCSGTTGTSSVLCAQDNFYSCPGGGCELYTVSVNTASYTAGAPSDCTPYGSSGGTTTTTSTATNYTQPYPAGLPRLAYTNGTAITTKLVGTASYPNMTLTNAPAGFCPVNAPSQPDWPASPGAQTLITLSPPTTGTNTATLSVMGVQPLAGVTPPMVPLTPGMTYTFTATGSGSCNASGTQSCACQQVLSVNAAGTTATSLQANCCNMANTGYGLTTGSFALTNKTLPVGGPPYACAGPNPPPPPPPGSDFTLSMPFGVTVTATVTLGTGTGGTTVTVQPPAASFALKPGQTYTLQVSLPPSCTATYCSCQQAFTVNAAGTGVTSPASSGNCCGMGTSSFTALPVAAGFGCSGASAPSPGPAGGYSFSLGLPGSVTASVFAGTNTSGTAITTQPPAGSFPVEVNQTYTLAATLSPTACKINNSRSCTCQQRFTVNAQGTGFTTGNSNCCNLGTGTGTTLSPGAAFNCAGP